MRYLLDANILSNNLMSTALGRGDLFVLREVANEYAYTQSDILKITNAGIKIIDVSKKHLKKLCEVMADHGDNFKLISLQNGKGAADVLMIAYTVSEKYEPERLFVEEYTIVTVDKELTTTAKKYGIKCAIELN